MLGWLVNNELERIRKGTVRGQNYGTIGNVSRRQRKARGITVRTVCAHAEI
jgi:hypothetical protein